MIKLFLVMAIGATCGWLGAPLYWRLFLLVLPALNAMRSRLHTQDQHVELARFQLAGMQPDNVDGMFASAVSIRKSVELSIYDSQNGRVVTREQALKLLKECAS